MNIEKIKKEIEQRQLALEWHEKRFALQYKLNDWPGSSWEDIAAPSWGFDISEYRRKPESKIVPWTFGDISPEIAGAWFECHKDGQWVRVVRISNSGLWLPQCESFLSLCENYQYSTDLKIWQPCGKVVS